MNENLIFLGIIKIMNIYLSDIVEVWKSWHISISTVNLISLFPHLAVIASNSMSSKNKKDANGDYMLKQLSIT